MRTEPVDAIDAISGQSLTSTTAERDDAAGGDDRLSDQAGLRSQLSALCEQADERVLLRAIADLTGMALDRARQREVERQRIAELTQRLAMRTSELEEANADLEAFSRSVSHDLRAPLRAMRGFGTILLDEHGDDMGVDGRELAERIVSAANRMDSLIADLLAYSRISRAELKTQPTSLGPVVRDALTQLEAVVEERQAEIHVEEPLPGVVGHHGSLVQVVTNLLSNALKFVSPGVRPVARIWAEPRGHRVRIWVADNGIGISPESQERVYREFERLHGEGAYPGTGMGLAIVRRAVERMGGFCGVESELGQGSRFWIELAAADDAPGPGGGRVGSARPIESDAGGHRPYSGLRCD